jgi:hypothetical protein
MNQMKRLRKHVSPGLVVGVIALIAATSGSAIALSGSNTVDKGDLKKNSVGASEFSPFVTGTVSVSVASGAAAEGTAGCPQGQAVSGGVKWDNQQVGANTWLLESYLSGNGWYARAENDSPNNHVMTVEVYCLQK